MITSSQNPRVKGWVLLRRDGQERRRRGLFLLEGTRAAREALAGGAAIVEMVLSRKLLGEALAEELTNAARQAGAEIVEVSQEVLKKVADARTPQGVCCTVRFPRWETAKLLARRDALWLVACGLQDPGNVGTLLRSALAAESTGLIALPGTADVFGAKVLRATAGAVLRLPVLRLEASACLAQLRAAGVRLLALEPGRGASCREADLSRPLALFVGAEGEGLPREIAAGVDGFVSVPIAPGVDSLNAAVAASVVLLEAYARRPPDRSGET